MAHSNEPEEVSGYLRTQWDCPECGEVCDVEGDASSEIVACDACGFRVHIMEVK